MANYNKDTDYTALIAQAVKAGNYAGAALLEQQRNNKIVGEGLDYEQTNDYAQYLPQEGTNPYGGSASSVYTFNAGQSDATNQMNHNSAQWWAAKGMGDTNLMTTLEQANQNLAGMLGGTVTYNPNGTWSGVAAVPATTQASMNTGVSVQQPAPYQSAYDTEINNLINNILNRDKFSYDAESDPLFQQYKNIYTREGNRSMNDTLAAAASGAGGMSSYAMTAAQQANNYYMAQLGDKIPELQQLAYEMYLDDIGLMRQDVSMLMDKDNMDYNRYRDDVSDFQWGTSFNYDASRDAVADQQYKDQWEYGVGRDEVEDSRYESNTAYDRAMTMLMMGVMPDADMLKAAGISTEVANSIIAATKQTTTGGGSGGSGGSGYTGGSGGGSSGSDSGNGYTGGSGGGGSSNTPASGDDIWQRGSEYNGVGAVTARLMEAENAEIDMNSVIDLGRGPINEEELVRLEMAGEIVSYIEDGTRKFRNRVNPTQKAATSPFGSLNDVFKTQMF